MRRTGRVLLIVTIVVAVIGAIFLITSRNALADSEQVVDNRWTPMRAPLTQRYLSVGDLARKVGGESEITGALQKDLDAWTRTGAKGREAKDAAAEVQLANRIEGLTARLVTTVNAAPKLAANPDLVAAANALPKTAVSERLVDAYNRGVRDYKNDLDTLRNRPAAAVFGFDPRDAYEPALPG